MTGLIGLGSDTKSTKTDLLIDAVHWKIGKGTYRNAAGGVEEESGCEIEYSYRCVTRNERGA
jgi:hypothetical protein